MSCVWPTELLFWCNHQLFWTWKVKRSPWTDHEGIMTYSSASCGIKGRIMWCGLDLMGMRRPGNKWTLFQNTLQRCFKSQLCVFHLCLKVSPWKRAALFLVFITALMLDDYRDNQTAVHIFIFIIDVTMMKRCQVQSGSICCLDSCFILRFWVPVIKHHYCQCCLI